MLRQKRANTLGPSRLVGIQPITKIYTANQLDGILNAIGEQLATKVGGAAFYNPAGNAPPGTLNAAPSIPGDAYTVTITQSSDIDATRLAFRATDHGFTQGGSAATGGEPHTAAGANGWNMIDFNGRRLSMTYVAIRQRSGASAQNSMTLMIQGSHDASSWTNVLGGGIVTSTSGDVWYSAASTVFTSYRYFRVLATAGSYCLFGDIEYWGTLT